MVNHRLQSDDMNLVRLGSIYHNGARHENLLRWAANLTKDCDVVENRFKYLRPGTASIEYGCGVDSHLYRP